MSRGSHPVGVTSKDGYVQGEFRSRGSSSSGSHPRGLCSRSHVQVVLGSRGVTFKGSYVHGDQVQVCHIQGGYVQGVTSKLG